MIKSKQILCMIISICMIFMLIPDINFLVHAETLTNDNIPDTCNVGESIPLLASDIFKDQEASIFDESLGHTYGISSITASVGSAGDAGIYNGNNEFTTSEYNTYGAFYACYDYNITFKANQPGTYSFTSKLLDGDYASIISEHIITITVSGTVIQDSTLSSSSATFDAGNPANISVTMTPNGNTLDKITLNNGTVIDPSEYDVSGNTLTIKIGFLKRLAGVNIVTLDFSAGTDPTFTVTVTGGPNGLVGGYRCLLCC